MAYIGYRTPCCRSKWELENNKENNNNEPIEPVETRVVAKYNVIDTFNPTQIIGKYADSLFSVIEIDGVAQPSVVSAYTFSTEGEHTVKYTLTDPTSIGSDAFGYCTDLTSINIPSGVTTIDTYAFADCSSLTSIVIPDSVTSIGSSAFAGCYNLASINITDNITSIGSDAFCDCNIIYGNDELRSKISELSYSAFYCD